MNVEVREIFDGATAAAVVLHKGRWKTKCRQFRAKFPESCQSLTACTQNQLNAWLGNMRVGLCEEKWRLANNLEDNALRTGPVIFDGNTDSHGLLEDGPTCSVREGGGGGVGDKIVKMEMPIMDGHRVLLDDLKR